MSATLHPWLVQYVGTAAFVNSITTSAIATTSGNLLVAIPTTFNTGTMTGTPITDSAGNTWTSGVAPFNSASGNAEIGLWYAANCIGSGTHTFTFTDTAGSGGMGFAVLEIGGCTSTPLSNTSTGTTVTGGIASSGSNSANASVPEIFVGAGTVSHGTGTPLNQTSPWAQTVAISASTGEGIIVAVAIVDPSGSETFTYTYSGITGNEAALIAGFKAATSGGGGGGASVLRSSIIRSLGAV